MVEIGLVQACTNNDQVVLEVQDNKLPIEPRSVNDAIEAITVSVLLCAEAPKLFVVEAIHGEDVSYVATVLSPAFKLDAA